MGCNQVKAKSPLPQQHNFMLAVDDVEQQQQEDTIISNNNNLEMSRNERSFSAGDPQMIIGTKIMRP